MPTSSPSKGRILWDYLQSPQIFSHLMATFIPLFYLSFQAFWLFDTRILWHVLMLIPLGLATSFAFVVNRIHHTGGLPKFLQLFTALSLTLLGAWGLSAGNWNNITSMAVIVGGFQIFSSYLWQQQLFPRVWLMISLKHQGRQEIRKVMREYYVDASFTETNSRILVAYQALALGLNMTAVSLTSDLYPKPWILVHFGFQALLLVLNLILFRSFREEMNLLTRGYRLDDSKRIARIAGTLVLLFLAALVAMVLPREGVWIQSPDARAWERVEMVEPTSLPISEIEAAAQEEGAGTPAPIVTVPLDFLALINDAIDFIGRLLVPVVPWALLALLIFALVRFFISIRWSWHGFLWAMRRLWRNFIQAILRLWNMLLGKGKPQEVRKDPPKKALEDWIRLLMRKPPGKLSTHRWNRLVKGFIKVLDWGEKEGLTYRKGQTTGEYLNLVLIKYPSFETLVLYIKETLHKVLFGGENIDKESLKQYSQCINALIHQRQLDLKA